MDRLFDHHAKRGPTLSADMDSDTPAIGYHDVAVFSDFRNTHW